MRKILLPAIAVIALAFTFNSCSMEKRHYMKGYYIDRNNHKEVTANPSVQQNIAIEKAAITEAKPESQPVIAASVSEENNTAVQSSAVESKKLPATIKKNKAVASTTINSLVTTIKPVKKSALPVVSQAVASPAHGGGGSDDTVLLVILAILLPPLAVYLYEGSWTHRCWVNLILTLLCGIPGIIHALIVVLS